MNKYFEQIRIDSKKIKPGPRRYQTLYWVDARQSKPISQGFCKTLYGAIHGAVRALAWGYVPKVQILDRTTGQIVFTWKIDKATGSLIKHKGDV